MSVLASFIDTSGKLVSLAESRGYCEQLTRREARNFYYGLKLLPPVKRSAMFALYAYMRLIDDIADAEDGRSLEQREEDLDAWQHHTLAALDGRDESPPGASHAIWPAFIDMVRVHGVPASVFTDAIAGQRQDLRVVKIETFDELRDYCYRVAGVVGVGSIYVWGFSGGATTVQLAVDRGIAFQLTNILRDLREDAIKGRTYLPVGEMAERQVTHADLLAEGGDGFMGLMQFQIARARDYYERSAGLENRIAPDSRATLIAMTEIYRRLLDKVSAEPRRVLRERVSLSLLTKLRIGWRATRAR